jgi:YaiO family outer membrane protein
VRPGNLLLGGLLFGLCDLPLAYFGATASEALVLSGVEVEAGASREVLTRGEEPWEDYWVRAIVRPAPATHVYGGVRYTRRFGEDDQQLEAGGAAPLGALWSMRLDGTWSPTHRVLPIWAASGTLRRQLPRGWGVFFGGGRTVYEATGVNDQHVGVDRRIAAVRLEYRLQLHQIDVGGSGIHHRVTGTWFYATPSSVSLGIGTGREALVVGPGDVRNVSTLFGALWGIHWLDDRTGVSYTFAAYRHGDFFTRTTSSVGVRRRL